MKYIAMILSTFAFVSSAQCDNYRPTWKVIQADNGAEFAIDLGTMKKNNNGTATAVMCPIDNDRCREWDAARVWFDCNGHYINLTFAFGRTQMAPRYSVIGQMAQMACGQ